MAIYRLVLEAADGFGSQVVNVMHYQNTVLGALADAQVLADLFDTSIEAEWAAIVGNGCEAKLISVRNVADPDDGYDKAIAWTATRSGQVLPAQVCGVLALRTTGFSRASRGSIHLPAPTEGDNDGGSPNSTYKSGLSSYGTAIQSLDDTGVTIFDLVVYSRTQLVARKVTYFVPSDIWGVLHSRRPGRGA